MQMLHESTYEQFAGEWLLQTSGTVKEENGSLDVQEVGEEFPVTILLLMIRNRFISRDGAGIETNSGILR